MRPNGSRTYGPPATAGRLHDRVVSARVARMSLPLPKAVRPSDLSGETLYGDDFDAAELRAWLADEEKGFYNLVTDVDPGNVPHLESVIAHGSPPIGLLRRLLLD